LTLALSLLITISPLPAMSALPLTAEANADVKRAALTVVASILKSAAGLRSPSNRIKVRSLGVTLIAASDPNLARTSCQEIESDFAELYSAAGDGVEDGTTRAIALLRVETVRGIADSDATMAIEVLRSTTARRADRPSAEAGPDDAELEAYVAGRLIDKDPGRAYELIRSSQSGGYSAMLPDLLQRLGASDMGLARDAANALADSLVRTDLAGRQDAFFTAVGLITVSHTVGGNRTTGREEDRQLLTREKEAALITKLVAAATRRRGAANDLALQLAGLLLVATDVAPESASALRRELESPRQDGGRAAVGGSDFWERAGERNLAEAVGLIGREPKEARAVLYQQAALRAISSGDTAQAQGIAERFITSPNDLQEINKQVAKEELRRAIDAGDLPSARVQSEHLAPEERAQLLIEAANGFRVGQGVKRPLNLLEEARVALNAQPRNVAQLNLRLRLAAAFARFDAARAGEVLGGAVAQLNDVLSAAAALDGYLSDGPVLKDGELDLTNSGAIIGMYLMCAHTLASLSAYDYERAEAIADQFRLPEAQMMAKLLVAEGVLSQGVPDT
jgi:hypothetical protein